MLIRLNCGWELGALIEVQGATELVVGEPVNETYLSGDEQEWYPDRSCEVCDDGPLEIDDWYALSKEAQSAIIQKDSEIRVGDPEESDLVT